MKLTLFSERCKIRFYARIKMNFILIAFHHR
jgi:hypothetical protein